MAPKKRPHGKDVVSSSSTPPHYDRRRFWNEDAENNYTVLMGRNMHRERGVDTSLARGAFLRRAESRNWLKFVQHPEAAVKNLVREFYANLKVKHENHRVRVRGKMVAFDSKTINEIYEMQNFENDGYRVMMSGTVPYEAILDRVCIAGAAWKLNNEGRPVNFESKYLSPTPYNWFVFITSRIMPSNHTSEVTKERAALLHCIYTDEDIDVGRLIQASILHSVRGATTLSMPHTSLITDLCRHAGVVWDDTEELLPPRGMIDILKNKRNRRGVVEDDDEDEPAQQIPVPLQIQDPIPQPHARTMEDRMTALEQSLDLHRQHFEAHRRQTEEHMRFMHDFTTALSLRFPSSSADYMPFPQPPSWPSQSRDADGDDDVDMGPGGGNEY